MQAGLSWLTVLNKREAMRRAFHGFDPKALAEVADIEKLDWLKDSGLIRHRGKLNGMITNARIFDEMIEPGRVCGPSLTTRRYKMVGGKARTYHQRQNARKKCHEHSRS